MSNKENQESSLTPEALLSSKIFNILKHYEGPILHIQRLLVWENVLYSSVFMAFAHVWFWYLFTQSNHVFGVFFSFVLLIVWVDFWKHKIWPEIRAVEPNVDDDWGELNPHLLSVKEMCDCLANYALAVFEAKQFMLQMRISNPGKFCFFVCSFCMLLMFVGEKVHGAFVMYLVMLCMFIWPLVWYHKILEKAYAFVEPFLMQLQYTLQQRPGNTYQLAQSIVYNQSSNLVMSDEDEDLEEFLPKLDEKTAAVLAKAITDDSELSETDEEILAQELPTFSRATTPSNDDSDDIPFAFPGYIYGQKNDEIYEVPVPSKSSGQANLSLSIPSEIVADTVNTIVKETFSSITHSMNQSNSVEQNSTPESNSSLVMSDYEFVVLEDVGKNENE